MPDYRVIIPVEGGWRIPSLGPIFEINRGARLILRENEWAVSVEVSATNETEAIQKGRTLAGITLNIFQSMLDYDICRLALAASEQGGLVSSAQTGATLLEWAKEDEETIGKRMAKRITKEDTEEFQSSVKIVQSRCSTVQREAFDENGDPIPAIYYFGRALEEQNPSFKLLNCVTVIEALISESLEATEKVARRVAALCGAQPSYLRYTKQELYDLVKDYYNKRSRILHGAEVPRITSVEANDILRITQIALRNYLILANNIGASLTRNKKREFILARLDKFLDEREMKKLERELSDFLRV